MKLLLIVALLALCACERKTEGISYRHLRERSEHARTITYLASERNTLQARVKELEGLVARQHSAMAELSASSDRLVRESKLSQATMRRAGKEIDNLRQLLALRYSPCDGISFCCEYRVDTTTGEMTCVAKEPRP